MSSDSPADPRPVTVVVPRVGIGLDVHPFENGRPLWVAGLHWPGETGLAGHSDADVVAHACCDALLSAAGLGDLGTQFGTSDPAWAGASGAALLGETVRRVREGGYEVGNVAVQLIGNAASPRPASRRGAVSAVDRGRRRRVVVGDHHRPARAHRSRRRAGRDGDRLGLSAGRSPYSCPVTLRIYDTASRQLRDFEPIKPGQVSIYLCGATVQAPPHIGHVRSAVAFDVLARWLSASGHRVVLCRNVTDIDDKILGVAATAGVPWWEIARTKSAALHRRVCGARLRAADRRAARDRTRARDDRADAPADRGRTCLRGRR